MRNSYIGRTVPNVLLKSEKSTILYMKHWLTLHDSTINPARFKEYTGVSLSDIDLSTSTGEKHLTVYAKERFGDIITNLDDKTYNKLKTLSKEGQSICMTAILAKGNLAKNYINDYNGTDLVNDINTEFELFGVNTLKALRVYNNPSIKITKSSHVVEFLDNTYPDYLNSLTGVYGILNRVKRVDDDKFIQCVKQANQMLIDNNFYDDNFSLNAVRLSKLTITIYLKGIDKVNELLTDVEYPENIKGNKFLFFRSKLRKSLDRFDKLFDEFDKLEELSDNVHNWDNNPFSNNGNIEQQMIENHVLYREYSIKCIGKMFEMADEIILNKELYSDKWVDEIDTLYFRNKWQNFISVLFRDYKDNLKELDRIVDETIAMITDTDSPNKIDYPFIILFSQHDKYHLPYTRERASKYLKSINFFKTNKELEQHLDINYPRND